MTRFGYTVALLVLLALGSVAAGAWWYTHRTTPSVSSLPVAPATPACTIGNCPSELTAADTGKAFTYSVTSRFSITLPGDRYPHDELSCTPAGVIGYISNGSTPPYGTTSPYTVRYEGVTPGTCMLVDRDFSATIVIVSAEL